MSDQEEQVETRELIEEIVNENPQEDPIKEPIEELIEEVKPKAKPKTKAKAKAKVKIIKEPVIETVIEPEPVIEEKPQKVDKLKETVKCPDCGVSMSQHTLKYIHKKRGYCKAVVEPEPKITGVRGADITPDERGDAPFAPPPGLQNGITNVNYNMTDDMVNQYIKENPEVVSNYLRNERLMKTQKRQMNARSLLNNAF